MEVLGAAAAALQLANQCFAVLHFIDKVRISRKTLKTYQVQLASLRQLSESIAGNPLLQTEEIGHHTNSILSVIEGQKLGHLPDKGRIYCTWVFFRKERSITQHYATLETLKTTLVLSIQEIQSRTLYEINIEMSNTSKKKLKKFEHTNPADVSSTSLWEGNTAGRECTQINGFSIIGATATQLGVTTVVNAGGCLWKGNTKQASPGTDQQNTIVVESDSLPVIFPGMNGGAWIQNKILDTQSSAGCSQAAGEITCHQRNGPVWKNTKKAT